MPVPAERLKCVVVCGPNTPVNLFLTAGSMCHSRRSSNAPAGTAGWPGRIRRGTPRAYGARCAARIPRDGREQSRTGQIPDRVGLLRAGGVESVTTRRGTPRTRRPTPSGHGDAPRPAAGAAGTRGALGAPAAGGGRRVRTPPAAGAAVRISDRRPRLSPCAGERPADPSRRPSAPSGRTAGGPWCTTAERCPRASVSSPRPAAAAA